MHHSFIKGRGHSRSLRNACRKAFGAVAAVLLVTASYGQNHPNGLRVDSVHPRQDSVFLEQIRHRMDSVRRTQHRPTVAIVLSGGGAKGAAQTGALKYLEEQKVPIDLICGTSIGGLIGGMYSVGYRSPELRDLFVTQDWSYILTDKIESKYYNYNSKLKNSTYALSVPFFSNKHTLKRIIEEERRYRKSNGMDRPFDDGDDDDAISRRKLNRLSTSLPSGYAYGFNVNNLLASKTVGFQDSLSFATLPIPFVCVATDMVSCKSKNWGSGDLKTAMRSTMSIPGLFDPVRTQGTILVDGGTRNNYPTDIARAAGADYVIGIELGDERPSYSQVNHLGDLVSQFITMLGKESYDKNIDDADIKIKPDLRGYNMLSFNEDAVDTMLVRGYDAAREHSGALDSLKLIVGTSDNFPFRKATDISVTPVTLRSISFAGLTDRESKILMRKIRLKAGEKVMRSEIDRAMSIIQGTGALSQVTYSLHGAGDPYDLVFYCVPGPTNHVGLGARLDTDEWVSIALNLGINTHRLWGHSLDLSAKLGLNLNANLHYALNLENLPTINVEVFAGNYRAILSDARTNTQATLAYWTHREKIYLSNMDWSDFDLKMGFKNEYFNLPRKWEFNQGTSDAVHEWGNTAYLSVFADGAMLTLDDMYYPKRGMAMHFGYQFNFIKTQTPDYSPVHVLYFDVKKVFPITGRLAFIPSFHTRNVIGQKIYSPMANYVGGSIAGRYFEQQIPFVASSGTAAVHNYLAVVNLDLRYNPLKNLYVSLQYGALKSAPTVQDQFTTMDNFCHGFALEAGYDTIAGPFKAKICWNNAIRSLDYYISFGMDF